MARGRKVETGVKRDNKGRILPKGISQRKDGRYIWRYTYEGVSYKPVYSWDLKALKQYADEEKLKIIKGTHIEPNSVTLNEYFYYWMETYQKDKIKPVSYQNNCDYWKWYMQDYIGKKKVQKVTPEDLIKHYRWLQNRVNKPISWNTVLRINSLVSNMYDRAVQRDLVAKNPTYKIMEDVPKVKVGKKREALSLEWQGKFIDYISNHKFYRYHKNLFTFLFGTGCRVGEACALCFEDLDFEEGKISIFKTLYYRGTDSGERRVKEIGSTKTENSTRTLPMLPGVKQALMGQLTFQKATRQKCCEPVKTIHWPDDVVPLKDSYKNFVFLNQNDTAYTPDYVTQMIKKIVSSYNKQEKQSAEEEHRKPELMPEFSAHITRHTFATRCANDYKLPMSHISRWLGHSIKEEGASTTTIIYVHWDNWLHIKDDVEKLKDMKIS